MKVRAIVVEDEPLLRLQLGEMLAVAWPGLDLVASLGDGPQALAALDKWRPDVMFLDVEMPEMSGLEVARRANGCCHVAFVTAYSQYAVSAFEAGAIDYVLKPIDAQRLGLTCRRLQERLASAPAQIDDVLAQLAARVMQARPYLRWITAARGANVRLVTVGEVCYFQSDSKYTRVVTASGESLIHSSLKELADQLDPSLFWQVHRSTIVNAQAIDLIGRDAMGHMVLRFKGHADTVRVSQPFEHRFRQM